VEREATFFPNAAAFRRWLTRHHASASELWVGYYRKGSGKASLSWAESVDEALCFGWIDGIRKKFDDERYANRFTPRRTAKWSAVNIRRAKALIAEGRMSATGQKAFEARDRKNSGYSIAQRASLAFAKDLEAAFRANRAAWAFFESQPPGYRKNAIFFVMSAKQDATRRRRLDVVIALSAAGRRLDPMRPLAAQRD
jgi:uncharacterized protein YdeI (YjbR/CyaY-like superfamily)